jgi:hypothetical protein
MERDNTPKAVRSLQAQIAEVKREIAMRRSVYGGLVARRKMKQGEADERLLLMLNVLQTLEQLAFNDRITRAG